MAVNQSQVDHILSTASVDDPEVRLQNLQDEVDLLKKSVKKLLIDLREKMNEMDNPFIVSTSLPAVAELPEKVPEVNQITPVEEPEVPQVELQPVKNAAAELAQVEETSRIATDEDLLASLQERYDEIRAKSKQVAPSGTLPADRPRLQKLHQLFEWISKMVSKYGHDRLDIMTGTYHKMGYISDETYKQINDIARLMPESIGDFHEVGSEEFISELYLLNRILTPEDSSLDREMLEVIMEKKESGGKDLKRIIPEDPGYEEDWIEMLEKI